MLWRAVKVGGLIGLSWLAWVRVGPGVGAVLAVVYAPLAFRIAALGSVPGWEYGVRRFWWVRRRLRIAVVFLQAEVVKLLLSPERVPLGGLLVLAGLAGLVTPLFDDWLAARRAVRKEHVRELASMAVSAQIERTEQLTAMATALRAVQMRRMEDAG